MKRDELASRRRELGLSQERLAQRLGVATQTVSRWERGEMTPVPDVRERYADSLQVSVSTLSHWIDNGNEAQHLAPRWFSLFVSSEQTATHLDTWSHHVIPGLLQTEPYARALIGQEHEAHAVDQLVSLRMSRRSALFRSEPLALDVVLSESALLVKVDGDHTMRDQMRYLLELSEAPNVRIRVLPFSAGPHTAEGSFHILTMGWGTKIVYNETYGGSHYLESGDDITRFERLHERLRSMTLGEQDTTNLIKERHHALA